MKHPVVLTPGQQVGLVKQTANQVISELRKAGYVSVKPRIYTRPELYKIFNLTRRGFDRFLDRNPDLKSAFKQAVVEPGSRVNYYWADQVDKAITEWRNRVKKGV